MFTYRKIFKIDCEVERARLGMRSTVGYHVLKKRRKYIPIYIYLSVLVYNECCPKTITSIKRGEYLYGILIY